MNSDLEDFTIEPPSNKFRRQVINNHLGLLPYISGEMDDGDVVPREIIALEGYIPKKVNKAKRPTFKQSKSANGLRKTD